MFIKQTNGLCARDKSFIETEEASELRRNWLGRWRWALLYGTTLNDRFLIAAMTRATFGGAVHFALKALDFTVKGITGFSLFFKFMVNSLYITRWSFGSTAAAILRGALF